ncbi:uncharacterized protein LOC132737568 isoform X2 [Ruditapes philippinarum]|nr:uncharacterized protein LOC132737568 isoform X2 [Ruditapes philippinarum]
MLYAGSKVDTSKEIVYNTETAFRYSDMAKWKNIILLVSMVITLLLLISQLQTYRLPCSHVLFSRENKERTVHNFNDVSKEQSYESEIKPLSLSQSLNFSLEEFYATDLTTYPEQANKLSPLLTKRSDVIAEAQRIHMNIFSTLLKGYKYAMLFDYSPSENKGDAAIVVGEATLLRRLNIDVVFACSTAHCGKHLDYAEKLSKNYSSTELVILLHGGGNIIGYHYEDKRRFEEIPHFKAFNIIMFPQSIFHRGDTEHIELCKKVYSSHPSLTFIWRDSVSYKLGKRLFPNVRSLLSPDIVFQLGPVKRFMDPTQDILWIKRTDAETPVYDAPKSAGKYRMHVADWKLWSTPKGTSPMEDSYLMTANGMMFLSRGRVVVTDRLHGFILCTLLNIPHVFIDNKQHKLSNYHNTWTHGLENLIMATSSADAVVQAQYLLKKLDKELPKITGYYKNTGY